MNHVVKTIITVLAAVGCSFVCLLSVGFFFSETDFLKYDVERMADPVITDAEIQYLGESYEGEQEEGAAYYLLTVTLDNQYNFGREESGIYLGYDSYFGDQEIYMVRDVSDYSLLYSLNEGYYYPAGKTSVYRRILCIENGCQEFDIVYSNYYTDEEQRIHVNL